jgi:hypothetical protein
VVGDLLIGPARALAQGQHMAVAVGEPVQGPVDQLAVGGGEEQLLGGLGATPSRVEGGQLQILGRGAAGASPQRVGAGAAPGFLPIFFSPLLGASSISRIIPRISTGVDRPEGPPRHGVRRGRRARAGCEVAAPYTWPGLRAGLWLQVEASRRQNDPRKATCGC